MVAGDIAPMIMTQIVLFGHKHPKRGVLGYPRGGVYLDPQNTLFDPNIPLLTPCGPTRTPKNAYFNDIYPLDLRGPDTPKYPQNTPFWGVLDPYLGYPPWMTLFGLFGGIWAYIAQIGCLRVSDNMPICDDVGATVL